ncbi:MAG: PfkB family carbohydrate kinase [Lachnospiraceae bacterium]
MLIAVRKSHGFYEKKVVCIGQALVDCITRGKEPWRERAYRAQSISLNTGGDALNEASLLAKMGIPVSLVCGLGKTSPETSYIRRRWKGVSTYHTYLAFLSWRLGLANLTVHPDGSREVLQQRGQRC